MSKEKKQPSAKAIGINLKETKPPEFWDERLKIFDRLYAAQLERFQAAKQPIVIKLPDGKTMDGESWVTTPLDIAKRISNSLPDKVIVAKVDGQIWDLTRPFEGSCSLELLDWEDKDARRVFWHSSAHVLGYALERLYDCKLSYGPPLEDGGFFYEGLTSKAVSEADYPGIKEAMLELSKAKAPFQRLILSKEDALQMFGYNKYKQITLGQKVKDGGECTVYRCGSLIDPCKGPHLPDTGRIKAIAVTKNSSAYFQGDANNDNLQRVYAITFPKEAQLKEWQTLMEEAAKRDHRTIGRQQELFHFNEISPGSAFWTPMGARIYNALIEYQRKQYRKRGFEEVITPNMYNSELWRISGHWEHYQENMFITVCEKEQFALKPMNCPGHCMMFRHRQHSYKDLPIRWADFGALHRNELSGALTGLTRVRRFQQDDAHIFCRLDQVTTEIQNALDFIDDVYGMLGFKFYLKLSTRPDNALGSVETWNEAEARLSDALNHFCGIPSSLPDPTQEGATFLYDGTPAAFKKLRILTKKLESDETAAWKAPKHQAWELNPKDGAFYGPKIDIVVEDALKRRHQCATVQLDFQLPERFGLKYTLPAAREVGETSKPAEPEQPPVSQPEAPSNPSEEQDAPGQPKRLHVHIDRAMLPNETRPVMIHRAIFGSLERCVAILCEHYGGKWPFWLSPRQVIVIPIAHHYDQYAQEVAKVFYDEGFHAEADCGTDSLDKKIRNAQIAQFNFILVVGEAELKSRTVNIRCRMTEETKEEEKRCRLGEKSLDEALEWFLRLRRTNSKEF